MNSVAVYAKVEGSQVELNEGEPRLRLPTRAELLEAREWLTTQRKRKPPSKEDKLMLGYLMWTSNGTDAAREYCTMKCIGPVLDRELSRWKSQLHIILQQLKDPPAPRQRGRRVPEPPPAAHTESPPGPNEDSYDDEEDTDEYAWARDAAEHEPAPRNPRKISRTEVLEACVGTTQRDRKSVGTAMTQKHH
jgi:hypothetical protein